MKINIVMYALSGLATAAFLGGIYLAFTVNPHSISWLIAAIFNFYLAVFVFHRNRAEATNRIFALLGVSITLWCLNAFELYLVPDAAWAVRLSPFFAVGTLFVPPLFFHFILHLTRTAQNRRMVGILCLSYALSLVLAGMDVWGVFVHDYVKIGWKYTPRPELPYVFWMVNFTFWMVFTLLHVFRSYRRTHSPKVRIQLKYFFLAALIGTFFSLQNFFVTLGFATYPLGGIFASVYMAIVAYSIVKHQLMDINVIIKRSIVYAALTLSVAGIYAVVVGAITAVLGANSWVNHGWFVNGLAGAIVAAVFLPLRTRIQDVVDRLFFKEKYNYRHTLRAFSEQLTSILEVDMLSEMLVTRIMETMHIDRGCMLLRNNEKDVFEVSFSKGTGSDRAVDAPCGRDVALVMWLEKHRRIFILDENSAVSPVSIGEGIIISIPLIVRGKLIGAMNLGRKLSEEMYTSDDLELLTTLANHAAIALENATLSAQMRVLEKNLYQTDKLTALGTFASSIAHEIKNPLASVKTFCQLVSRKFGDVKFIEKFNSIVPAEIERLEGVLGQMLDFGKLSGATLSPVRIERVIDDLISLIRHETFRQNVRIIRSYGEDVPSITASEEQLKQVFMNLFLNAMQAMPGGGEIRLSTARVNPLLLESPGSAGGGRINEVAGGRVIEGASGSCRRGATAGNAAACVEIRVADNGCGIPKESIDKLFKPFFTTKPNGTGLGLSITKKIIREHGGSIEVESTPGKGTIFTVRIPA